MPHLTTHGGKDEVGAAAAAVVGVGAAVAVAAEGGRCSALAWALVSVKAGISRPVEWLWLWRTLKSQNLETFLVGGASVTQMTSAQAAAQSGSSGGMAEHVKNMVRTEQSKFQRDPSWRDANTPSCST